MTTSYHTSGTGEGGRIGRVYYCNEWLDEGVSGQEGFRGQTISGITAKTGANSSTHRLLHDRLELTQSPALECPGFRPTPFRTVYRTALHRYPCAFDTWKEKNAVTSFRVWCSHSQRSSEVLRTCTSCTNQL
jgi:hypothetical protein